MLFCSSNSAAKHKSILEEEFNRSKETYNQQQKIYKSALERYEQKIEQNKSFMASKEQKEEYNSLQEMYKRQQEDYYKLSELDRQLKEELKNRQSPFQLVFLGIGFICLIPATAALLIGITLFYILKKPSGQKLTKLGILLGSISGLLFLLATKNYVFAFAGLIPALIYLYFYFYKK